VVHEAASMTCHPPVAECDAFWRQVFARAGLSKWKATKSDPQTLWHIAGNA